MNALLMIPLETEITIGEHRTVEVFGLTINVDTVFSTVIAGLIVIGLGFWMRRKVTSGVPSKIQVIWEAIVDSVTRQVEESLGRVNPFVIPLAIALFTFILIANWLELIPSGEEDLLVAPTADVNLTYALALLVIVGVHVHSIRERGLKGYTKHYFEPYSVLFPLNLIEELVKPVTLALRLFGNIFSGGIMLALIGLLPLWIMWGPNAAWKLFAMFIGVIQAFIFALLTILYFGMAGASHADERHDDRHEDRHEDKHGDKHKDKHEDKQDHEQAQPVGAH
jgi:F-type H+-transporting ATPase subunit a